MKKNYILVFLFMVIVSLFVGCASVGVEPNDRNEPISSQAVLPTDGSHPAPPKQLIFYSMEEVEEFYDAEALSDEELEAYLDSKGYSMNGVSSREEFMSICGWLNNNRFPSVKDATFVNLKVYVETEKVFVMYEMPKGEIISFKYSVKEPLEQQQRDLGLDNFEKEWSLLPTTRTAVAVYEEKPDAKSGDNVNDVNFYLIKTDDLVASLRMSNINTDEIEAYIEKITFGNIGT